MSLPYSYAQQHQVLLIQSSDHLQIMASPKANLAILSEIQRHYQRIMHFESVTQTDFDEQLALQYSGQNLDKTHINQYAADIIDASSEAIDLSVMMEALPKKADVLDSTHDAPIIRMINALLTQAVRDQASDIHIEPFEHHSVVRFRIDGKLRDIVTPQRALHAAFVSRIKIMASLDIAEKRLPQDGRIALQLARRPIDVRVSTLPTLYGERVVMRLLDKETGRLDVHHLGLNIPTLATLQHLLNQPHGILLVTGPTGSGKSTSLYASVMQFDVNQHNIMTVEDPIEFDIQGVAQTPVNNKIDMGFAKALRAILRQDPDIIMIGEIRDLETAQIAVQASMTGHLVLATLHTNDAVSAPIRLLDMGIEPFLLAPALLGILAQRLIRKLCPHCRQPDTLSDIEAQLLDMIGNTPTPVWRAQGCPHCAHTGYLGRTGIYELIKVDPTIQAILAKPNADQALRDYQRTHLDTPSLRQDGLRYILNGTTSPEEILRCTRDQ